MIPAILALFALSEYVTNALLFEDEKCQVPATNEEGRCIKIYYCKYARNLLKKHKYPGVCGFRAKIPLVCCPLEKNIVNLGVISRRILFQKTLKSTIVELGEKAAVQEFPHVGAVGYGSQPNISWACGGTLISHFFVLSAAHCVLSVIYGPAKWIRLGDLDLNHSNEISLPTDMKILHSFVHPEYKSWSHYHDIALFEITRVYFTPFYKPACLQSDKKIPVDTLEAAGWGKLGYFGEQSSHLMKVDLKIVDFKTCAKKYRNIDKLENGILDEYHICAGDVSGKDTCPGDSGGPLHYEVEENEKTFRHFVVAGVVSFGKGCGGEHTVAVYTRVSAYVGWIEKIVWGKQNYD